MEKNFLLEIDKDNLSLALSLFVANIKNHESCYHHYSHLLSNLDLSNRSIVVMKALLNFCFFSCKCIR